MIAKKNISNMLKATAAMLIALVWMFAASPAFAGILGTVGDVAGEVVDIVGDVASTVLGTDTNEECNQTRMDSIYRSGCYACKVVKSLISAFVNGCANLENVSKEGGKKLLILGFVLWIVFYVIKQISSWKNIEPAAMVNDLLIMAFKVLGAWFVIQAGYQICVDFVLVPFLSWGTEFGTQLLSGIASATGVSLENQATAADMVSSTSGFLPAHLLNNIISYVAAVDGTTSQHMKLGHMLTCHSCHVAKWAIMPNIWIWICGAAIWFFGFMMTLAVVFYLIDMSFKLAIALIALPIVIGLWPFGITRDRLSACVKMILNASGIFIFLAMTTSVGLVIVDKAIAVGTAADGTASGIQTLYTAIEEGNSDFVDNVVSLWGSCFILLVFAYLYALKVIGSTLNDYVNKFFSAPVLQGQSPMHHRLTKGVDAVKNKLHEGGRLVKDIVKTQTTLGLSKAASFVAAKTNSKLTSLFGQKKEGLTDKFEKIDKAADKLKDGKQFEIESQKPEETNFDKAKKMTNLEAKDSKEIEEKTTGNKPSDSAESSSAAAKAIDAAGDGLKESGEAIKQASKSSAEAVKAAGSGVAAAGDAAAIPTLGVTAVVGHTTDAAAKVSATGIEVSGQVAGEIMKQTGNVMKQTAKVVGKAEKAMKKTRKAFKKATKLAKKGGKTAEKAKNRLNEQLTKGKQNSNNNSGNNQNENMRNEDHDDAISNITSSIGKK